MKSTVFGMLLVGSLVFVAFVAPVALDTSARADSVLPDDAPVVKVISTGDAPTRKLRLLGKVRSQQTVIMAMDMGMGIQSGGKDIVPMIRIPQVRMTLALTVDSVAANGDLRCTFKIGHPELVPAPDANPAVIDAMKKAISGIDGMSGYAVVSNRGFTKEADFKVGPNMDPQLKELLDGMRQSLHQLSAPLPEEAVGKGARWETTSKLAMNGLSVLQTATYDLVELAGDSVKLEVTLTQRAANQKIQRNGVTVDLISLASSGSGTMAFKFTQLIASPATISLNSVSEMEAMGQKMNMKIDMKIGISRK